MEAIFIGIYVYGWERLSPRMHFVSGIPIAITGFRDAWSRAGSLARLVAVDRVDESDRGGLRAHKGAGAKITSIRRGRLTWAGAIL